MLDLDILIPGYMLATTFLAIFQSAVSEIKGRFHYQPIYSCMLLIFHFGVDIAVQFPAEKGRCKIGINPGIQN
jgi:hypothetical protein